MKELRSIIAENIVQLRKQKNITQAELAVLLNFSDKAVSKWERAESVPDVATLKKLAEVFGVSMDYLTEEEHPRAESATEAADRAKKHNRIIITMLSAALVFLVCTIVFVTLGLFAVEDIKNLSLIYLYAVPVVCVVLLVFNSIWGKRVISFVIISVLLWSILLSIYFSFTVQKLWLIFLIGIPGQIIIFLWANLKTHDNIMKYGDKIVRKHLRNRSESKTD